MTVSPANPGCRVVRMTPDAAGAVAIIQLHGPASCARLAELTGVPARRWPVGFVRLVRFVGIDEGLAVRLTPEVAQLMPHGGPRIVSRLLERLQAAGDRIESPSGERADSSIGVRSLFPEAHDELEAWMLEALARAASPAAIDLLLIQPRLWRARAAALGGVDASDQSPAHRSEAGGKREGSTPVNAAGAGNGLASEWAIDGPSDTLVRLAVEESAEAILERSLRWRRLLAPPQVAMIGRPNVGKSTLLNRLAGRRASLVTELPGATRDWVGSLVRLGGVCVSWIDTPGRRRSDDPIERRAIELSTAVIEQSDLVVELRDPAGLDQPTGSPRTPDLVVMSKSDLLGRGSARADAEAAEPAIRALGEKAETGETGMKAGEGLDDGGGRPGPGDSRVDLTLSAKTGEGLERLEAAVLEKLGLADVSGEPGAWRLWAFHPSLERQLQR